MFIDSIGLTTSKNPLEIGALEAPSGKDSRVELMWSKFWADFNYNLLCAACREGLSEFPSIAKQIQPEMGPKVFLESIALHHAARRWQQLLSSFLEGTEGYSTASPEGFESKHLWQSQLSKIDKPSIWVQGIYMRQTYGASIDNLTEEWNLAIASFDLAFGRAEGIEDVERAIARCSEELLRTLMVRFVHINYAHCDVVHFSTMEAEHPFHHALHMIDGDGISLAEGIVGSLLELSARYDSYSFPYPLDIEFHRNRSEKSAGERELGFKDWTIFALRDYVWDKIRSPEQPPIRPPAISGRFELGVRHS